MCIGFQGWSHCWIEHQPWDRLIPPAFSSHQWPDSSLSRVVIPWDPPLPLKVNMCATSLHSSGDLGLVWDNEGMKKAQRDREKWVSVWTSIDWSLCWRNHSIPEFRVHYIQLDREVGFLHITEQGDSYCIQIKKEAGFIVYCWLMEACLAHCGRNSLSRGGAVFRPQISMERKLWRAFSARAVSTAIGPLRMSLPSLWARGYGVLDMAMPTCTAYIITRLHLLLIHVCWYCHCSGVVYASISGRTV